LIAGVIPVLNQLGRPILAVDIPTGVDADTGAVHSQAIMAEATATMALLKRGLLFSPGREHAGTIHVVDISMPQKIVQSHPITTWKITAADVAKRLPSRPADAHKNSAGTLAILAGSRGFTGAAALTAESALRSGSGLVYLGVPLSLQSILATKLTEVITWPFEDGGAGYFLEADYPAWHDMIAAQKALAMGPGMGTHSETGNMVHRILRELDLPLVLDADGLNLCAGHLELIRQYPGEMVLTPHTGELARLIISNTQEINKHRIEIAIQSAQQLDKVLVLKGGPTIIALPDGTVFINSTGNAGMATAGSGDVLTGIIAGLLSQGLNAKDAALCGVYLHGLAGDLAMTTKGIHGLIASDMIESLPQAIKKTLTIGQNEPA
jgi:NAD(P)H-hydrate epimerase